MTIIEDHTKLTVSTYHICTNTANGIDKLREFVGISNSFSFFCSLIKSTSSHSHINLILKMILPQSPIKKTQQHDWREVRNGEREKEPYIADIFVTII